MIKIAALFVGGGFGTLLRYFMSSGSQRLVNTGFPVGTITINLSGSFLIGLLWALAGTFNVSPNFRAFIFIGVLGGYTTFSTFMLENLNLLRGSEIKAAVVNLLFSNFAGLALVFIGYYIGVFMISLLRG